MTYPRKGVANQILDQLKNGRPGGPEFKVECLDHIPGMDDALIEFVAHLMERFSCCDDLSASALCALYEYFWSGHSGILREKLPSVFQQWIHCRLDEPPENLLQNMIDWMDVPDNPFISGDHPPICCNETRIAPAIFRSIEMSIANRLRAWLLPVADFSHDMIDHALDGFFKRPQCKNLDRVQRSAITHAWKYALTVVTGGPGTGKTSSVVTKILESAPLFGIKTEEIAVCAPTGKAAQRISECFDQNIVAQTIHRLLKLQPNSDSPFKNGDYLPARLVIVDEVSMISLLLAEKLFSAVNPRHTRLILIGDADQLPPVDSGEILSNFTHQDAEGFYGELATLRVHLKKNYRIKSEDKDNIAHIMNVQRAVIDGKLKKIQKIPPKMPEQMIFRDFEYCLDLSKIRQMLDVWCGKIETTFYEEHHEKLLLSQKLSFHKYVADLDDGEIGALSMRYRHLDGAFRVLTPTNLGACGANELNQYIGQKLQKNKNQKFAVGTLVMLTQNNYQINHFNGETGIIVELGSRENQDLLSKYVAFPKNGEKTFDFEPLDILISQLTPAFAITIHKSQGSEYQHGLIILPPGDSFLLSRNLLYTAISRTKKSAILMAEDDVLKLCVTRKLTPDPGVL